MIHRYQSKNGFSLVELSIVIVIVATIMGASVIIGQSQISKSKYDLTIAKMEAIDQALVMFLSNNGRLPCPSCPLGSPTDTCYGYEQLTSSSGVPQNCISGNGLNAYSLAAGYYVELFTGSVPFYTLGLSDEYLYDGWNRQFNYNVFISAVNNHLTNSSCVPGSEAAAAVSSSDQQYICFRGQKSASASYPYSFTIERTLNGNTVIWDAVYTLISYGQDGLGAYVYDAYLSSPSYTSSTNPNEEQDSPVTTNGSQIVVTTAYNYASGSYTYSQFDDIVFFKTRDNMLLECNKNYNLACTNNWDIKASTPD